MAVPESRCPACGALKSWSGGQYCAQCGWDLTRPAAPAPAAAPPPGSPPPAPPPATTPSAPLPPPPGRWEPPPPARSHAGRWILLGAVVALGAAVGFDRFLSHVQRLGQAYQQLHHDAQALQQRTTPASPTPASTSPQAVPAAVRGFQNIIYGQITATTHEAVFPAALVGPTGQRVSVRVLIDSGNSTFDGVVPAVAQAAGLRVIGQAPLQGVIGSVQTEPLYQGFTLIPEGHFWTGTPGATLSVAQAIGFPNTLNGVTVNLGQATLGHDAQFVEIKGQWWFGWNSSTYVPPAPVQPQPSETPTPTPSRTVQPPPYKAKGTAPPRNAPETPTQERTPSTPPQHAATPHYWIAPAGSYLSACPPTFTGIGYNTPPTPQGAIVLPGVNLPPPCLNPTTGQPPTLGGPGHWLPLAPQTIGPESWPVAQPFPGEAQGLVLKACFDLDAGWWRECLPAQYH